MSSPAGGIELRIAPDHPAFDGHFPGTPLLPGALLLDEILRHLPGPAGPVQLAAVKFRRPVRPGAVLTLHFESLADGGLRFVAREDGQPVVDGTVRRD